jgi:hypothetical protein
LSESPSLGKIALATAESEVDLEAIINLELRKSGGNRFVHEFLIPR